jgi:3-oxoacyl-[acyl-carrier-protein] synthase-3
MSARHESTTPGSSSRGSSSSASPSQTQHNSPPGSARPEQHEAQRRPASQGDPVLRPQRPGLRTVYMLGTGAGLPESVLDNAALERMVDTSDEWIMTRTGVRERRIVAEGQKTSDLATAAGRAALEQSGLAPEDLQLIIVASASADHVVSPPTVCLVQQKLGAVRAAGFDLNAACSGFQNALSAAHGMLAAGSFDNALILGAESLSRYVDYQDRVTCILFGDGAGAAVLRAQQGSSEGGSTHGRGHEILDHVLGLDGSGSHLIEVPAGGSARPVDHEALDKRENFIRLDGRQVFRFAVQKMPEVVEQLCERNGYATSDIDVLIPHQANQRIIDAAAQRLGIPSERIVVNVDRYGNTSSASVPVALDEAARSGRIREGDLVCTVAFGGGLSWGGSLIRW